MRTLTIILLDGAVFAAVLFLISVGLTLVFGVLRILNVSHGGIYAFGAYLATFLALRLLEIGGSPYLTYLMLLVGPVIVGLIAGPLIERVFLQRVYGRAEAIQLLLTFSIFLILDDLMKLIWGTKPLFVSEPYKLLGEFSIAGIRYSWYQVLLILVSIVFGGALVWAVRGTRFGKIVVSVINDREISQAIGINVNRIFMVSFTLGAFCAALGGALVAPTIAVVPGFAVDATVLAFAVIAIGGMGSLEGAALGALIVGLLRALAVHLLPEADLVVIYLAMILVLVARPQGLFGQVELRRI
ncbi:MAG TPA: branched-chain amino acid ABC transporter permease [Methylomirabilota bacterium]|jgi:branched-chain amino acid transport system permease protein|nr:branched-chain amino acid ABC transporter permease [Methylomirabilota bacterium]